MIKVSVLPGAWPEPADRYPSCGALVEATLARALRVALFTTAA